MWNLSALRRVAAPVAFLVLIAGCPTTTPPDNTGGGSSDAPFLDTSDNSSFDRASALALDAANGTVTFRGEITSESDLDIFELGSFEPGDAIFVDVQRTSGDLDAVGAIFDKNENVLVYNDDREADGSNLNPLLDGVVHGAAGEYFLGIASLLGTGSSGAYEVTVRVTRGAGIPAPQRQIVFLDWNGGSGLTVENVGVFDLAPFDASDVGPFDSTQTGTIKDRVQQIVADRYSGFALQLLNSDDDPEPTTPHTTVFFGGNNRRAFAISAQIDSWNRDPGDNAIIFTRSFDGAFAKTPTVEEISTALGNTVSHEIGHLLGLVHTKSCNELMDTTCGNSRILQAQFFGRAELDDSTFPIGFQNASELLGWILGQTGI